jgi:alpha-ketoglutarate-dependent taurine dioxygenase
MAAMIDVRPLTPTIGAEVFGVDLSTGLDDPATADTIRKAFIDRRVLVFRDQQINWPDVRVGERVTIAGIGRPVASVRAAS